MSEAPDPLEAELSALQPHKVSPALRRRVGQRLAEAPSPTGGERLRRGRWLVLAGALAAACVAAVLLWWVRGRHVEPKLIAVRPEPTPSVAVEDSEPTLLAYQRALAHSPEELDALLDRQAVDAPELNPEPVPIGACIWSDAAIHALLGED